MLQYVLTNLSSNNRLGDLNVNCTTNPDLGSNSANMMEVDTNKEGHCGGSGSSEKWWDLLGKSLDDEVNKIICIAGESAKKRKLASNVRSGFWN